MQISVLVSQFERLFQLSAPLIGYSGRNKEIISLVRRTSVTSSLLVRHSHHLSNK